MQGSRDPQQSPRDQAHPDRGHSRLHHLWRYVSRSGFRGDADVQTFCLPELVATKLRALYQRSKGRDLFDLWLALARLDLAAADIVECVARYRPDKYTGGLAEQNLRAKLGDRNFRNDLNPLVAVWPAGYEIDSAAEMVIADVFSLL